MLLLFRLAVYQKGIYLPNDRLTWNRLLDILFDAMVKLRNFYGLAIWLALLIFGGVGCATPTAVTPDPTPVTNQVALVTITPTLAPTSTPTPTPTGTPTITPSPSPTITPTPDPFLTPTATHTPLPLPTPTDAISRTLKVPILMYHYISTPPEDADIYRTDLSVEPTIFAEQMAYLAENGYQTVDFYDLSRAITDQQRLPEKPVILTFDDGYRDNYENAFPILEQYGFKGTFFIPTEFIDVGYAPYMTWEMIAEMARAGHRFEPHSRTHIDMRGQDRETLIWQILGPQETLAYHIGYTPKYFSYPSGWYDQAVIDMLRELNFWGAVSTQSGQWHGFDGRYEWRRLRIRYTTPLPEFAALVNPGDAISGIGTPPTPTPLPTPTETPSP